MKRIVTFGVFDLIHVGHIRFLENCKGLIKDSKLIVVISRDSVVLKEKGKKPVVPEEERREIIASLKPVDEAILGNEGSDKLKIVEEIKPDIIVLGYDQVWGEKELEEELKKRSLKIKVMRLKKYCNINSSDIKDRLKI
jgi:FAD synthetase